VFIVQTWLGPYLIKALKTPSNKKNNTLKVQINQDEDEQKKKNTTENKKDEQHIPHQKPGVNPGARKI